MTAPQVLKQPEEAWTRTLLDLPITSRRSSDRMLLPPTFPNTGNLRLPLYSRHLCSTHPARQPLRSLSQKLMFLRGGPRFNTLTKGVSFVNTDFYRVLCSFHMFVCAELDYEGLPHVLTPGWAPSFALPTPQQTPLNGNFPHTTTSSAYRPIASDTPRVLTPGWAPSFSQPTADQRLFPSQFSSTTTIQKYSPLDTPRAQPSPHSLISEIDEGIRRHVNSVQWAHTQDGGTHGTCRTNTCVTSYACVLIIVRRIAGYFHVLFRWNDR